MSRKAFDLAIVILVRFKSLLGLVSERLWDDVPLLLSLFALRQLLLALSLLPVLLEVL